MSHGRKPSLDRFW